MDGLLIQNQNFVTDTESRSHKMCYQLAFGNAYSLFWYLLPSTCLFLQSAETFLKGWRVKTEPFRACVLLQGVDHLNLRYWIKEISVRLPGFK